MKQVLIKNGIAKLEEVPIPRPDKNELIVRVSYSCISPGTERKQMFDSKSDSLIASVIKKPERVKKAYKMMRDEGIGATVAKARGRLDLGKPCGYSLAGTVIETGDNVKLFSVGDRVACAGAENSFHAEFVCVPHLLTVHVPDDLDMREASTVALGAISLHGLHRSGVLVGEYVAVIGLGALGQITGLLLQHAGCKVIGFDLDASRLQLAKTLGFHMIGNPVEEKLLDKVRYFTKGHGVDAVIVTAASSDAGPLTMAANICRKKGKVIVVGDAVLNLNRDDWYAKEIDLLISTSYGPGRYDSTYEKKGRDYPYAYVRWTENRNMEAYLDRLASGLNVKPLIREIFPLNEVASAFECLEEESHAAPLILLQYPPTASTVSRVEISAQQDITRDRINVAVIGPGEFALDVHLPNLRKLNNLYCIYAIMGKQGHKAKEVALRYGARYATTDYSEILEDPKVDLVFITTRDDLHAPLAIQAARVGKAIFMEKPMATSPEQLSDLEQILRETRVPFMVGFNRRFSPHIVRLKEFLDNRHGPAMIYYRVNTEPLSPQHWIYSTEGGGRIVGEGCHFMDLLSFLVDSDLHSFTTCAVTNRLDQLPIDSNFQVTLKYKDGSLANLFYTSLGSKNFPKEYMEVFFDGQVITLDSFIELKTYEAEPKQVYVSHEQKGHLEELKQLAYCLKGKIDSPIKLESMIDTTRLTFKINQELKIGKESQNES